MPLYITMICHAKQFFFKSQMEIISDIACTTLAPCEILVSEEIIRSTTSMLRHTFRGKTGSKSVVLNLTGPADP